MPAGDLHCTIPGVLEGVVCTPRFLQGRLNPNLLRSAYKQLLDDKKVLLVLPKRKNTYGILGYL